MKNTFKFLGIIALVAVIGFTMAACGGGDGGNTTPDDDPTSETYTSYDSEGTKYELEITKDPNRAAAFKPHEGDTYVLTITPKGGTPKTSTGTVKAVNGNDITLENINGIFTVTIDGKTIKSFKEDNIPVDDGEPVKKPETLAPSDPSDSGTPITGAATLNLSGQVYTKEENTTATSISITYTKFTGNLEDIIGHGSNGVIGGSGKITNGVLSFTIGTPEADSLVALDDFLSDLERQGYTNVNASEQGVKGAQIQRLLVNDDEWSESLYRRNTILSNVSSTKCSWNDVQVVYIYVDADVTISAKGYNFSDSDTYEGVPWSESGTVNDLNLQLKKGWNSVCTKVVGTQTITGTWDATQSNTETYTVTVSLDNPDLKWVL